MAESKNGWVAFDPLSPGALPTLPAVYVIFRDGTAVYVGQTVNLRARFSEHRLRPGWSNTTTWSASWGPLAGDITAKARFSRRYGDWAMWELRLIKRLQPELNVTHVRRRAPEAA